MKARECEGERLRVGSQGSLGMGKCMVGARWGKRLGVRGGEGSEGSLSSLTAAASVSALLVDGSESFSRGVWFRFRSVWSVVVTL